MVEIPNKFPDPLGPFALVSRSRDDKGNFTHWGCQWLRGFVTYKSPYSDTQLSGAIDSRVMKVKEIKSYLADVRLVFADRWDAQVFVVQQMQKLKKR